MQYTAEQNIALVVKRFNERATLVAALFNILGAASFILAAILPSLDHEPIDTLPHLEWLICAAMFHLCGHLALAFLKIGA